MKKNAKNSIESLLDELASAAMMVDVGLRDDIDEFCESLKNWSTKCPKSVDGKRSAQLMKDFAEFLNSEELDDKQLEVAITDGVRLLQEAPKDKSMDSHEFIRRLEKAISPESLIPENIFAFHRTEDLPEFISNAVSMTEELEHCIMELEKDIGNEEMFNNIFRVFHTLKGEAGMLGLIKVTILSHLVEHFFEKIREGEITLDSDIVTMTLEIVDTLKELLSLLQSDPQQAVEFDVAPVEDKIFDILQAKLSQDTVMPNTITPEQLMAELAQSKEHEFVPTVPEIDFALGVDLYVDFASESFDHLSTVENSLLALESDPGNPEEVNRIFRGFHTIKGLASFLNLEDMRTLSHDTETMMDMVRKGTMELDSGVVDAVLLSVDCIRRLMELLQEQLSNNGVLQSDYPDISEQVSRVRSIVEHGGSAGAENIAAKPEEKAKIGEILVNQGVIDENELADALEEQRQEEKKEKIGEILVKQLAATSSQIKRGLDEQNKTIIESTIKIGISKLDHLIEMVGELVIIGTQVAQNPDIEATENFKLIKDVSLLDKTIRDIQGIVMSVRLVPIRPVFQKMQRLIRDLSKKSGKDVSVALVGEDTEVDKNIIDLIGDPMMHMVRNAVDHGIEPIDKRVQAGKAPEGRVELNAYHKGNNIIIEIKDDGGGLPKDKILAKALDRGLIKEGQVLEDSKIFNLIFEPGFSTAEKITDISGRGVGMDVVKRNIDQLRGKIDIESKLGVGTTFFIRLPLTLASIDGIVLELAEERFVAPIYSIIEFVNPRKQDLVTVSGKGEMLNVRGDLLQLIRLEEFFEGSSKYENIEERTACIVDSEHGRACVLVDGLIGQQQVVIKSLGDQFRNVRGVAGATILGDGKVGLILDFNGIVGMAQS